MKGEEVYFALDSRRARNLWMTGRVDMAYLQTFTLASFCLGVAVRF